MLDNVPRLQNNDLGLFTAVPGLLTTWWVPENLGTISNQALTHLRHNLARHRTEPRRQRSLSKNQDKRSYNGQARDQLAHF